MTVQELKSRLDEMPDNAEVIMIGPDFYGYTVTDVKYKESTIHKDGVVQICANA